MTKKLMYFAVPLGIVAGLFWAKLALYPTATLAAQSQGLDVGQIQQEAAKNLPSFDDTQP